MAEHFALRPVNWDRRATDDDEGSFATHRRIVQLARRHLLAHPGFTKQQYRALAKLTAALCTVLPRITCDYPRDADGRLVTHKLAAEMLQDYHGVLGHYHVQTNKVDPGPALQWDYVIGEARRLMSLPPQRTVAGKTVAFRPKLKADN